MELTKAEAAARLEVSERTIERLVSNGRLAVARYERGGRRPTPYFDVAAIDELKTELHAAPVVRVKPATDKSGTDATPDTGAIVPAGPDFTSFLSQLVETAAAAGVKAAQATNDKSDLAGLSVKRLLTLEEAGALAGVSRGILREAIQSGVLPARIIGRGWKVRPADLDTWVNSLFNDNATPAPKPTVRKGRK